MCRSLYKKIKVITILFVIIFSLFSNLKVIAVTDDDGPDVSNANIEWTLTCYSGEDLGTGFTEDDFTTNEKYGWCEYEKDGEKYVVLAAATHELLQSGEVGATRNSKLHYFNYYDTIEFTFADEKFGDSNTYKGIILDSCGASMDPTAYDHKENEQVLDVFFKTSTYSETISGQPVNISMDGKFSSTTGKTSSGTKKNAIAEFFYGVFTAVGDGIQILLNGFQNGKIDQDCQKLTYTRGDIEANRKLNRKIQVGDAKEISENEETLAEEEKKDTKKYKTMKTKNVLSTADNKETKNEIVYTKDTEIPVMPVEMYSSAIGKVDGIDIDFFNTASNNKNEFWRSIRKIISAVSHIAMYIAAAMLLTMLIVRAILFIRSALGDNPQGAYESRKLMDNFIKAILIISFIYLFMILMLALYKQLLKIFLNGNTSIYLIRVNVGGVYSFNTNTTGYLKYMTLNSNLQTALGNSLWYMIRQICNLAVFGYLFYRMLIIAGLVIIAPFTAIYPMLGRVQNDENNRRGILDLRRFMYVYITRLFLPLLIAFIEKAIVYIA